MNLCYHILCSWYLITGAKTRLKYRKICHNVSLRGDRGAIKLGQCASFRGIIKNQRWLLIGKVCGILWLLIYCMLSLNLCLDFHIAVVVVTLSSTPSFIQKNGSREVTDTCKDKKMWCSVSNMYRYSELMTWNGKNLFFDCSITHKTQRKRKGKIRQGHKIAL